MNFLKPNSLPTEMQKEARNQKLFPGEVLFNYQDRAEYVFALQKGRIRLERYTCEGESVTFYIIRKDDLIF